MPRRKKPPARPRWLPKRPLNPRQLEFIRLFYDPSSPAFSNATRAAEGAGYKGKPGSNQLAVQGHRLLNHPDIVEATRLELTRRGFVPEFVAKFLMRGMTATERRLLPNRQGKLVPRKVPLHQTRLNYFDRAWRIFEGKDRRPEEPASAAPLPTSLGGLPNVSDLPESAAAKLALIQKASPQERMLLREGYRAVASYVALKDKVQQEGGEPGNPEGARAHVSEEKSACDVGNHSPLASHGVGFPQADILRDYSLNGAQRRERLRAVIDFVRTTLSPDGLAMFEQDVQGWMNGGPAPSQLEINLAWMPDYINKPVSIRDFIYRPEFLGRAMQESIYPRIVDDLEQLFEGDYQEVVVGGSQRCGKSRMAQVGIAYELYQVSCLRDPGRAFGVIPGTRLAFVNASLTTEQARRVIFEGLMSLLKNSPYFMEAYPFNRKIVTEIRFLRGDVVCYPLAANEQAMMGLDIFSAAIDEANFMQVIEKSKLAVPGEGSSYDQIESVYNRLAVRLKGSWNQRGGRMPGHLWLISSARYPGDFTERKELEAKDNPHIFVRHYAIWDTKPVGSLSSKKFPVEVGDVTRRSRVLPLDETTWPEDVNRSRIIWPPMDYHLDFKRNPEKCVRDLAGISVLSVTPFIPRREAIRAMFAMGVAAGMEPTFTHLEVTLQNPVPEIERLLPEKLHWVQRQKVDQLGRPRFEDTWRTKPMMENILFPGLYYCHVDLSKTTDATGIVIAHAIGALQVPRLNPENMKTVYEKMPIIRVDLALRIIAPPNGEIDIPRVRALIHQFRNLGMEFGLVTFDTWGSQESVKTLHDAGFTSDNYSVDDDFTPWEEMKQALYDGRLMCYEFPQLEQELAQLERTPKKIDHPVRGSKDIADCLAAVVHHVEEGWRRSEGARGMFQFGLVERPGQRAEPDPTVETIITKVVTGQPLTPADEDKILFNELDQL